MKHWACPRGRSGVSCVCGVAMREGDFILIADRCRYEWANANVKYVTYNGKNLPDDAGITVSNSRFKVNTSNHAACTMYSIRVA